MMENISEIIFEWDWEKIVIPNKYLKNVEYIEQKKDSYFTYCTRILIEINLEYIKAQYFVSIFQSKNIWSVRIKYNNGNDVCLLVPSYRKEGYLNPSKHLMIEDFINLCECHYIKDNTYTMEWKELEEKDIYMTYEEMKDFFKKDNLSKISQKHYLGVEIFDKILHTNMENNCIIDKIEELSHKDNKKIIKFNNYKENIQKILYRIHKNYRISNKNMILPLIREGYKITQENHNINGLDVVTLNAKNNSYRWNFNFIFLPKIDTEEEKKLAYDTIYAIEPNEDTKRYFSRNILVFPDKCNIEQFMLEFYRKTYNNFDKIDIQNETLLFTNLLELNKIWYDVYKKWNLI